MGRGATLERASRGGAPSRRGAVSRGGALWPSRGPQETPRPWGREHLRRCLPPRLQGSQDSQSGLQAGEGWGVEGKAQPVALKAWTCPAVRGAPAPGHLPQRSLCRSPTWSSRLPGATPPTDPVNKETEPRRRGWLKPQTAGDSRGRTLGLGSSGEQSRPSTGGGRRGAEVSG